MTEKGVDNLIALLKKREKNPPPPIELPSVKFAGDAVIVERGTAMSMYELSERTKANLSACVGVPFDRIVKLSLDEEVELAAKKYGRKIVFSKKRHSGRIGRGNPLLARMKVKTLQDVERKILKVK